MPNRRTRNPLPFFYCTGPFPAQQRHAPAKARWTSFGTSRFPASSATEWQGGHFTRRFKQGSLEYLTEYGVDRAVLVQPVYPGEDNGYVADYAARRPDRYAAVVQPIALGTLNGRTALTLTSGF